MSSNINFLTEYQKKTGIRAQLVCIKTEIDPEPRILKIHEFYVMVLDTNTTEGISTEPVFTHSNELNKLVIVIHPAALIKMLVNMTKDKSATIIYAIEKIPIGVETITMEHKEITKLIKNALFR